MRIHLKNLEVRELYGRPWNHIQYSGFSEGITVVYGPNAAGKSTLAEGASRVFSTGLCDRTDRILAEVWTGGAAIPVDLHGPGATAVPQSVRPKLYLLSIQEFITGPGASDATQIRSALAGGVDLSSRLSIGPNPQVPRFKPDVQKIVDFQRNAHAVAVDEANLGKLKADLDEALKAGKDLGVVVGWIEAAGSEEGAKKAEVQAKEIELEYPGISKQTETAVEEADVSKKALDQVRVDLDRATNDLLEFGCGASDKSLAANDSATLDRLVSEQGASSAELRTVKQNLDQLSIDEDLATEKLNGKERAPLDLEPEITPKVADLDKEWRDAAQAKAEAARMVDQATVHLNSCKQQFEVQGAAASEFAKLSLLQGDVQEALNADAKIASCRNAVLNAEQELRNADADLVVKRQALPKVLDLPADDIAQELFAQPSVTGLSDQERRLRYEKDGLEGVVSRLQAGQKGLEKDATNAEQASQKFVDWLKALDGPTTAAKPVWVLALAIVLGLASIGSALAGQGLLGSIVGVIALGIVLLVLWPKAESNTGNSRQSEVESSTPDNWRPAQWTITEVASKLSQSLTMQLTRKVYDEEIRDVQVLAGNVNWEGAQKELEQRLRHLQTKTGLDFVETFHMESFLKKLHDYHLAFERNRVAIGLLQTANDNLSEAEASLKSLLSSFGCPKAIQTGSGYQALVAVGLQLKNATISLDEAEDKFKRSTERLENAKTNFSDYLADFEWTSGTDLLGIKAQFEAWFRDTNALVVLEQANVKASNRITQLEAELSDIYQSISGIFGTYSYPTPEHPVDGVAAFRRWFEVSGRFHQATKRVKEALDTLTTQLDRFGIPPDSDADARMMVLRQRVYASSEYRALVAETKRLRDLADSFRKEADEVVEAIGFERDWTLEQLQELGAKLERVAETAQAITEEIAKIEQRIENLESSGAHSELEGTVERIKTSCLKWLSTKSRRSANTVVKTAIEVATRKENNVPVLERANTWLDRLTQGSYRDIQLNGDVVTVEDVVDDCRRKSPSDLSTGRKVQLALAVRLAVIEQLEDPSSEGDAPRFPIFMDEVMATADPDASMDIVGAIEDIAKDRQVVVLTNQPDDVNLMRSRLGDDLKIVSLGRAEPVPVAPPAKPPTVTVGRRVVPGLPIKVPVTSWPARYLDKILTLDEDSQDVAVSDALNRNGTPLHGELIKVLETLRERVMSGLNGFEWKQIADLNMGGDAMRGRIHDVYNEFGADANRFLEEVAKVPHIQKSYVGAMTDRLSDLGLLDAEYPRSADLMILAFESLSEDLRPYAVRLVDLFKEYCIG